MRSPRRLLLLVSVLAALGCGGRAEEPRLAAGSAKTATRVHGDEGPYRVAVISDLNGSYGSTEYGEAVHRAVDRLVSLRPDLVLSTGDMIAGQRAGVDQPAMWQSFHAAVSDRLASAAIPFAVTPGNHDASGYDRWQEDRAIFVAEWNARRPDVRMVDAASYPLRYSFVAGPAFFVSLDATRVGQLDAEQMAWLEGQLAAAPSEVIVVYGHLPLHPFTHGREAQTIGDSRLEALLVHHGVDVFVSGHHHAYYPGRRGALRLVSTACLGSGPRPLIGQDHASERSVLTFEIEDGRIARLEAFGGELFDRRIERRELPASVGTGSRRIDRDDLGGPLDGS